MPLTTLTVTETDSFFTSASVAQPDTVVECLTTVTSYQCTTIPAEQGQTITILPLPPASSASSTAEYTPSTVVTETITVLQLNIYLQGSRGNIWTTLTIDQTLDPLAPSPTNPDGQDSSGQ